MTYFERVNYDAVFRRAKCVLHHGGVGTLTAAIKADCPSIVLPQLGCQLRFGRAMVRHGFATDVLPPNRVSAANLARAIAGVEHLATDARLRSASERLRAEPNSNGLSRAVTLVERHLERAKGGHQ